MQNEKGPAWAFARANELAVKYGMEDEKGRVFDGPYTRPLQVAFARYIAEHEEPPVERARAELAYCVENPSAWENFDQSVSDKIAAYLELARKESSHAG